MRFENIFDAGYYETALADIAERDGTLERVSNLRHFLERYLQLELTLTSAHKLSVKNVVVNLRDGAKVDVTDSLLVAAEYALKVKTAPVLEENVARLFFVRQAVVAETDLITSIAATDNFGRVHHSPYIADARLLSAAKKQRPLDWRSTENSILGDYTLRRAPSRIEFGPNLGNLGPHIGARLIPTQGSPYQAAIDDDEANSMAAFLRRLPESFGFTALTVREGAIFSDISPLEEQAFYTAKRAVHVVDNGSLTVRFIEPPTSLHAVATCLLVAFALGGYLCQTRYAASRQTLTLGYWVGDGAGILLPPGDSKWAEVDVTGRFGIQCADLLVDVLRANPATPARRSELEKFLTEYWHSVFPDDGRA